MNKKTGLGKNIFVFGLGMSLSKLMSVLLVGLYMATLSNDDFGYYEYLITIMAMVIPVFTVQIIDALYRHLLEAREDADNSRAVTNAFAVLMTGLILISSILLAVNLLFTVKYGWILQIYTVTSVLLTFSQQTARGLRRNTVFALSGVIYTGVMLTSNLILLISLGLGAEALLYSIIIADIIAVVFIELTAGVYRRVQKRYFDMGQVKSMCAFSIPMLPSAIVLVFLPFICQTVIIATHGIGASGVFAASAKFPALLAAALSIFGLAWQESAITEYDSVNRDEYYTKTFNLYMRLLLCALLLLLSVTRVIAVFLGREEFADAWRYIPFLYMGMVFSSFSHFYGTGYLSSKKTGGAFFTTLAGLGCGSLCLLFVPRFGIQAAALAQMTAYLVMFAARVVHTRRFFRIRVNLPAFITLSALAGLFTFGYFQADLRIDLVMLLIAAVVFILFNRELIRRIGELVFSALRKRKGV
jgi:O-antigen/teichoic acid export membrane protein